MFQFEISVSERREMGEIIAFNRNKEIKQTSILRNGNSCTNFKKNVFPTYISLLLILSPLKVFVF